MSTNIERIQVFYEIAMSIGHGLDLKKMAKTALSAYVKKLNCSAGAVVRQGVSTCGQTHFETLCEIPRNFDKFEGYEAVLESLKNDSDPSEFNRLLPIQYDSKNGRTITLLPLPDFGVLVLARATEPFDDYMLRSLQQLNLNLANACLRCVQNETLKKSEEKFRAIFESIQDLYLEIDGEQGFILEASPSIQKMTGYSRDQAIGKQVDEFFGHPSLFDDLRARLLESRTLLDYESTLKTLSGQTRIVSFSVSFDYDEADACQRIVGTVRDITDRKTAEEKIKQLAMHDSLTGLPNSRVGMDRLRLVISQAKRDQHQVAVLFLDLDGFKEVNDIYGHEAGDYVLKEVAHRLSGSVRESDTVARIGGDEFVVIMSVVQIADHAGDIAKKIMNAVSSPINFNGTFLSVGVSIGIALYPDQGDTPEQLLKRSDQAMYVTKRSGKNGYTFARDL